MIPREIRTAAAHAIGQTRAQRAATTAGAFAA